MAFTNKSEKENFYLSIVTAAFGAVAYVLMCLGILGCDYLLYTNRSGSFKKGFGIWRHSEDGSCREYSGDKVVDANWMASRVLSCLAVAFGTIVLIVYLVTVCTLYSKRQVFRGYTIFVVAGCFTGIFLMATAAIQGSSLCENVSNSCYFSTDAWFCLGSSILWLLGSFLSLQLRIEKQRILHGYPEYANDGDPHAAAEPLL